MNTLEHIRRSTHVVVGIEGSGTGWMARLLSMHPDIGRPWQGDLAGGCWHTSYPLWTGYRPLREVWPERDRQLLVMLRDRSCSEASRRRSGYIAFHGARADRRIGIAEMLADVMEWRRPPVFVSYEGLIDLGQPYFDRILLQMGLSVGFALTARDRNQKYFRA